MLAVFDVIRHIKGISRSEIVKVAKLSPSTVSLITEEMVSRGLIVEQPYQLASGVRGRRPVGLFLNNDKHFILALEVRYASITGVVFTLELEEVCRLSIAYSNMSVQFAENIITTIHALIRKHQHEGANYIGVGIGMHALVEKNNQSLVTTTRLGISRQNIISKISAAFSMPVYIDNIANYAGIMESQQYAKDCKSFIYVYGGVGVGSCIILNGKYPLAGSLGAIPELGHMSVDVNGRSCTCGNRGCLEQYVSIQAIVREVQNLLLQGRSSTVTELAGGNPASINERHIGMAAQNGDELCLEVVQQAASIFGSALVTAVNIFNPELIVIGGAVVHLGEPFLSVTRQVVAQRSIQVFGEKLNILFSTYDEPPILQGTASIVLDNEVPHLVLTS